MSSVTIFGILQLVSQVERSIGAAKVTSVFCSVVMGDKLNRIPLKAAQVEHDLRSKI